MRCALDAPLTCPAFFRHDGRVNYQALAALAASETQHAYALDAETVDVSGADQAFNRLTRGIWVGSTGNIAVVMASGRATTFTNVPDGSLLPIAASSVLQTGTTAGDVVALF